MNPETLVKKGITAAKAGHKVEASRLFVQALRQDQHNESAWYWLSYVVNSRKQCVECLNNVLKINPDNAAARKRLAQIQSSTIRCPQCGTTNRAGAEFCTACGQNLKQPKSSSDAASQIALCPHCGAKTRVGATVCNSCGQRLKPASAPAQAGDQVPGKTGDHPPGAVAHLAPPISAHKTVPAPPPPEPTPRQAPPASPPTTSSSQSIPTRGPKQRKLSNSIFCIACGTENPSGSTSCIQCNQPIIAVSLAEEQQLIQKLENSSSRKEQRETIEVLGDLKSRAAIPQFLAASKLKGIKNAAQINIARYALMEILIPLEQKIICVHCDAAVPLNAKFCYSCGARVSRPTAPPKEVERLIALAKNGSGYQQLQAIERLGQLRAHAALPTLLSLFNAWVKRFRFEIEALWVIEALVQLGETSIVPKLSQLTKELISGKSMARALTRLNRPDLAMKYFKPLIKPEKHDQDGCNLQFILEAAETCGVAAVPTLCANIMKEKRRWNPGIEYLIIYPDPILLLITATASIGKNLLNYALVANSGKSTAFLMVTRESIEPDEFKKLPIQTRKMVALHSYSTALTTIAIRDPKPVKAELDARKKPLERAVIGLALAQIGDTSVTGMLKELQTNSDWTVRLLASEGLVVIADAQGKAPGPDQLAALKDKDTRVRVAVARVMASTGQADYGAAILSLFDSSDAKNHNALLQAIGILASNGYQPAITKLENMARGDPDVQLCESAREILQALQITS